MLVTECVYAAHADHVRRGAGIVNAAARIARRRDRDDPLLIDELEEVVHRLRLWYRPKADVHDIDSCTVVKDPFDRLQDVRWFAAKRASYPKIACSHWDNVHV
jgi:hypothetical protein